MELQILELNSKDYPESLKKISNPPNKLYVLGNTDNLSKKGIAIIGSRCCSEAGKNISSKYAYNLSKLGFTIISGMAKGIDTFAHIGALEAGGNTIAVLGCGFNHIFPKENKNLFQRIVENGGTVISEYDVNEYASSDKFVYRNRIVSGLSLGVLVVEAKHRSGTSITANFAKKQGKKIFCIAHSLDDSTGEGTNKLIKHGAYLVTELSDITEKFDVKSDLLLERKENIKNVPEEYSKIYECIEKNICTANDIVRKLNQSVMDVNYALTMLELDGLIYKEQGKFYIKNSVN